MNTRVLLIPALLTLAFFTLGCQSSHRAEVDQPGWSYYGVVDDAEGRAVELSELSHGQSDVVIEGEIVDVCPQKGCWMRVREGEEEIFVRFQDYAFFVPRNATGRRVRLHGDATMQEMAVDELRHYAEDAGASREEIEAITEPQMQLGFMADAVAIEGKGLDEPHRQ